MKFRVAQMVSIGVASDQRVLLSNKQSNGGLIGEQFDQPEEAVL
jgi:hypothetical protein